MAQNATGVTTTLPEVTITMMGNESREMCFRQGKPCVYGDSKDRDVVVAEWANGVVSRHNHRTREVVRTWPDGRVERFKKGDPREYEVPIVPD